MITTYTAVATTQDTWLWASANFATGGLVMIIIIIIIMIMIIIMGTL